MQHHHHFELETRVGVLDQRSDCPSQKDEIAWLKFDHENLQDCHREDLQEFHGKGVGKVLPCLYSPLMTSKIRGIGSIPSEELTADRKISVLVDSRLWMIFVQRCIYLRPRGTLAVYTATLVQQLHTAFVVASKG
jgi:hypothetical protein